MLGQIVLLPYDFAPQGWLVCDGSLLPISEYLDLFQLLGTTYGGDGDSTFGLPPLSAAAPKGCNFCISLFGAFRTNSYAGIVGETVALADSMERPRNLIECTGGTFAKNQYLVLQQYIGNRFGGDGVNTFGLPNLTNKFPKTGYRYNLTTSGDDPNFVRDRSPFVGELILLPFNQTFQTLLPCNGSMLPVASNKGLYALIRNKFGGNDQQFAIPDLRNSVPLLNYNYYLSTSGVLPGRP